MHICVFWIVVGNLKQVYIYHSIYIDHKESYAMMSMHELEASYKAMNPWARKLIRELAASYAIEFPANEEASSFASRESGVEPCSDDVDQ